MTAVRLKNKMKFCFLCATIYMKVVQCYALLIRNPAQRNLVQHASLVYNFGKVSPQPETSTITNSMYRKRSQSSIVLASYMDSDPGSYDEDDELSRMRMEIDQLKREAAQRIDALSDKIISTSSPPSAVTVTYAQDEKERELSPSLLVLETKERGSEELATSREKTAVSNSVRNTVKLSNGKQKNLDLDVLEGTQWKMALNIGREPGTWMPKTWGISGERLRANLEIQFTSNQLYEREEFLGGVGGAKQCQVINNELTLGPSLTEGQRKIPIKPGSAAGGWRIAKGSGPLGTDLLRFYIDIGEEMSHSGSDVYCPKGRIYMQCGIVELKKTEVEYGGRRDQLKSQLNDITNEYQKLNEQIENEGFFSLERLKLTRKMMQVSMDARMVNAKLNDAKVIEPDKSILTISKEGEVGLTKEGGVVCKVVKGAVIEYHILGRFSLVAMNVQSGEE